MIKLYINDDEIKLEDKIALNSAFNETLDTGTIIIPNTSELAIKRLDKAIITNEKGFRKYFKVGTIVKEFETYEEPFKYKYTIELISPTIDLQSIVLPNVSITQPLEITGVAKRSIYYQLNRFVRVFAPEFTISDELKSLTENIICPENQYNRKNLFEIFNDLLINVPAVVTVLENNVISCIRLDQEGQEIDHNKIINVVETQRLDEYCTEIEINAENVVEGTANTKNDIAISPRSTEYIMTTDNAQLILDKPIYRIEKVEVFSENYPTFIYYQINGSEDVTKIELPKQLYDITKYVVEESVYNTKLPYNVILPILVAGQVNANLTKYKRAFLSYQQGSNVIDNLSYREKGLFGNLPQTALQVAFGAAIIEKVQDLIPSGATLVGVQTDDGVDLAPEPREVQFIVTYISQSGIRFRVKKQNIENDNYKLIIDNQSNSYVDSQSLWKVENENAKRLGNPELKINMILNDVEEIPKVASTFNGHVLTNSICNIYANKIIFEGYFTKDYVRKNLYTGIRSKARWTSIAKGSEALSRQDLILVDYELSTEEPEHWGEFLEYMVKNLENVNDKLTCSIVTKVGFTSFGGKMIDKSIYKFGNNLLFSFNFKDNFNAGMSVSSIMSSQYVMAQEPYTDDLGEFEFLNIKFFNNTIDYIETSLVQSQRLPGWTSTPLKIIESFDFLVLKDNREIYGADIQLRFNSNKGVKIKDKFVDEFSINDKQETQNLYFFGFNNLILSENDNNLNDVSGDIHSGKKIHFPSEYIDEYGITQPTWEDWDKSETTCWGVCNENYDILFYTNTNAEKLYFKKGGQKIC